MSLSSHHFPPMRHLPHWNRVGCLGKSSCPPRRLATKRLQPLAAPPPPPAGTGAVKRPEEPSAAAASFRSGADPRVSSLERSIRFLQEQHKETLEKLHAEVDYLRRENKELQYKLIMDSPKSSRKDPTHSQRDVGPPTKGRKAPNGTQPEVPLQDAQHFPDQPLRKDLGRALKVDLIASLRPLRVHSSRSHPPRAPTLQECEDIICHLFAAHSSQSQEILRAKTLLKEIVLSRKVTAENYILAKACLVDGASKSAEIKNFPKLGLEALPGKTCGAVLPALKQSLTSTTADRQRRVRAVQRNRFK